MKCKHCHVEIERVTYTKSGKISQWLDVKRRRAGLYGSAVCKHGVTPLEINTKAKRHDPETKEETIRKILKAVDTASETQE